MPRIRNIVSLELLAVPGGAVVEVVAPAARASDLFDQLIAQIGKGGEGALRRLPPEPNLYDKSMHTKKLVAQRRHGTLRGVLRHLGTVRNGATSSRS